MSNSIPKEPRIYRAQERARGILMAYNITALPVDVKSIIKAHPQCCIKRYSKQIEKHKDILQLTDLIEKFGQDGAAIYKKEQKKAYTIIYNDFCSSSNRIRWTLAHELGHIILNHHVDFEGTRLSRGGLSEAAYRVLDAEADAFAAELLAPTIVLIAAGWTSKTDIQTHCLLSSAASKNRSKSILCIQKVKARYFTYERSVLKAFYNHIFLNFCPECKTYFVSKEAKNCPICGGGSLMWKQGEVNIMKYSGIEVDKNCKAQICPKCGNEEIFPEGNFCMICGENITNYCEGFIDEYGQQCEESCGKPLPGNARYCPYCGATSHFLNRKFLDRWDANKTVPFDEEIPF